MQDGDFHSGKEQRNASLRDTYAELKKSGKLQSRLESNTLQAWNSLQDCREKGLPLDAAEELSLETILVKDEASEEQEEQERAAGAAVEAPEQHDVSQADLAAR